MSRDGKPRLASRRLSLSTPCDRLPPPATAWRCTASTRFPGRWRNGERGNRFCVRYRGRVGLDHRWRRDRGGVLHRWGSLHDRYDRAAGHPPDRHQRQRHYHRGQAVRRDRRDHLAMPDWTSGAYIAEEVAPWIDQSGNLVPAIGGATVGTPPPGTPDTPTGPPPAGSAKRHPVQPRPARHVEAHLRGRFEAVTSYRAPTKAQGNDILLGISRAKTVALPPGVRQALSTVPKPLRDEGRRILKSFVVARNYRQPGRRNRRRQAVSDGAGLAPDRRRLRPLCSTSAPCPAAKIPLAGRCVVGRWRVDTS